MSLKDKFERVVVEQKFEDEIFYIKSPSLKSINREQIEDRLEFTYEIILDCVYEDEECTKKVFDSVDEIKDMDAVSLNKFLTQIKPFIFPSKESV